MQKQRINKETHDMRLYVRFSCNYGKVVLNLEGKYK